MLVNVGILYERLISNLKLEINFLKNQLLAKDTFFHGRNYVYPQKRRNLRKNLSEKNQHFFSSTVAVNADEPPVNEDLANSKPEESAIRKKRKTLKKN